ncbi:MAG: peptidoglycan recognition family protein [Planctomycetota bacterium]
MNSSIVISKFVTKDEICRQKRSFFLQFAIQNPKSIILLYALCIFAFFLAGCGKQRHSANVPNVELRNTDNIRSSATAPLNPPASSPSRLRGPRSQAEIENLYHTTTMPTTITTCVSQPCVYQEPLNNGLVTAEPSWDVNVTREWYHIVVHHSATSTGCIASFDKAHRERGWDGLGYHFVIGNGMGAGDGEVEVGYRWTRQQTGAHAGNNEYNQHGIGICLVGNFENDALPSPRQIASLKRLVRFLQVKTGIPTSEVIGHCNVPGKKTLCPGNLDMSSFRSSLGTGAIGVPILFTARQNKIAPSTPRTVARGGAAMP